MRRLRFARLAAVALLLLTAAPVAFASSFAQEFERRWKEARDDESAKCLILDDLARNGSRDAAEILVTIALCPGEPHAVIERALHAIASLEAKPGESHLRERLAKSPNWNERALIVRAIGLRRTEDAIAPLSSALADKSYQVVAAAIEGLKRHRTREAVEALIKGFETLKLPPDDAARIAGDYRDALFAITGERFATARDWRNWWTSRAQDWRAPSGGGALVTKEGITGEREPELFEDVGSRRVVFVLDTSGSMRIATGAAKSAEWPAGLTRFEVMRREARRVVENLPAGARFNLVAYANAAVPWKPQLVPANEANKRAAIAFIDRLKADGETNSKAALEAAFKDPQVDTIYFLSDGFPTVGELNYVSICNEVARWNAGRNVRVHTIAFLAGDGKPFGIVEGDKSMPKEFMRKLAEENNGRYRLVE